MNTLAARITHKEQVEPLHLLRCAVGTQSMTMLSLQIEPTLNVGMHVILSVKSTDIMLSRHGDVSLSVGNRLQARVTGVRNGTLLSSITLDVEGMALESIMTLQASLQLELHVNDAVTVLIKESDIALC
ncbi:MAG: hypothetical protein DSZ03_01260 [Sulfurimonas sp.]|nr:MAG: hypothetical protein DSZ03_01260 [Sulfurimonas sp.]